MLVTSYYLCSLSTRLAHLGLVNFREIVWVRRHFRMNVTRAACPLDDGQFEILQAPDTSAIKLMLPYHA